MATALTVKPDRSNRNRKDTLSIAIAMEGELHDGLNLKEDVGGAMGFPDFLEALEKGRESVWEWAEKTEWKPAVTANSL